MFGGIPPNRRRRNPRALACLAAGADLRPLLAIALLALLSSPARAEDDVVLDRPGRSVEAPGGTVVLPPGPIPPDLLLADDVRVLRADLLLDRAEVLDTFVARFARQAHRLLARDVPDCAALSTLEAAIDLARGASADAVRTVRAELATLPEDPLVEPHRERTREASARATIAESEAWPALESSLRARCPAVAAPPTVWLPDDERESVSGKVAVYVRGPEPLRVVFVNGLPAGVTGPDGWAVVVAPAEPIALCIADPDRDECGRPVRVDAVSAAAFDLSQS